MTNSDNVPAVGIEATAYGSIAAAKNMALEGGHLKREG